jgi:hypothetical protein
VSIAPLLLMPALPQGALRTVDDIESGFRDGKPCGFDARDRAHYLAEVRALPHVISLGKRDDAGDKEAKP